MTTYDDSIGVGVDANGRAQLPLHTNARAVYVANSGSDGNDGLSPGNAKATIGAGVALLRDNMGDHLYLNRGDTWSTGLGTMTLNGLSPAYPLVFGAYGSGDRPVIATSDSFLRAPINPPTFLQNIVWKNIWSPGSFIWDKAFSHLLLENIRIKHQGVVVQDRINDGTKGQNRSTKLIVRFVCAGENYSQSFNTHANAFYTHHVEGLTIEDCVMYRGGWRDDRSIHRDIDLQRSHNFYLQTSTGPDTIFRRNLSIQPASHGWQGRSGGDFYDNVTVEAPNGAIFGYSADDAYDYWPDGINGNCFNNAWDGSARMSPTLTGGVGFWMENCDGVQVFNNLWSNIRGDHGNSAAGRMKGYATPAMWVRNCNINNNVSYDWERWGSFYATGQSNYVVNNAIENNEFDYTANGSNLDSAQISYPDTNRTTGTYNRDILGGQDSIEEFAQAALEDATNPSYGALALRNYLFAGFGLAAAPGIGLQQLPSLVNAGSGTATPPAITGTGQQFLPTMHQAGFGVAPAISATGTGQQYLPALVNTGTTEKDWLEGGCVIDVKMRARITIVPGDCGR